MARSLLPTRRYGLRHTGAATGAVERLRLPPGYTVRSLRDPGEREAVLAWIRDSPDHTLYHLPAYLDFVREQSGVADVLLLAREGNPLLALPVHSWDATGVSGGYSGVVFPGSRRERTLRRSVGALAELLSANRDFAFHLCQSVQAEAYEDPGRVTLLQCRLEGEGLRLDQVYCWLRELDPLPSGEQTPTAPGSQPGALALDGDWLAGEPTECYDHSTRKKIRNAVRAGLRVEYFRADGPSLRAAAYALLQPVHVESWARTGLLPKPPGYWPRLSEAVVAAGGRDIVVLVLDPGGQPVAGVICHAYRERGVYWSGCSSAWGLASQANPLAMHGAILACRREGVRRIELGRFRADEPSSKERSVTHYKAHFASTIVRVTSFSSTPTVRARARALRAGAVFETKRRLAVEIARARVRRDAS